MIPLWGLVVDTLTLITVVVSVWVVTRQIRKEHAWNRRNAAQDLVERLTEGEIAVIRRKLEGVARWYDTNHTYAEAVSQTKDKAELDYLVKSYLNFLEGIAMGLKHGVYDEKITFQCFGSLLPEVFRWSRPYIQARRDLSVTPSLFIEIEAVAEDWKEQMDRLQRTIQQVARPHGQAPL